MSGKAGEARAHGDAREHEVLVQEANYSAMSRPVRQGCCGHEFYPTCGTPNGSCTVECMQSKQVTPVVRRARTQRRMCVAMLC